MRQVIWCIIFFTLCGASHAQQQGQLISCHFDHVPFPDFAQSIFEKSKVRIYYEDTWVKDLRITMDADSITVLDAVSRAILGTGMEASAWNDDIILLPFEKLVSVLPPYDTYLHRNDSVNLQEKRMTESEERYLIGRMADAMQIIKVGKEGEGNKQVKYKILGRILDNETGEPMSFVTMYITEIDASFVADENGFVTCFLKPGNYNVLFEFLGYQRERYAMEVYSEGNFTVKMNRAVVQMKEFIVLGDRQLNMLAKDPGLDKISMKTIKEIPMVMGERNILNVSALLPGIVTVGEGSAGLNVRGGNADQNAFYLNKLPVYNTSHLFGFFPAFNSDVVKDFSIYKGYVPLQYGGRLSSVFNINARQGNMKRYNLHGGISPISANIVAEGPIIQDTCSFLFSARTSYSDWILRNIQNTDIRNSRANFYDFSGNLNYDIQNTQITLFGYRSHDHFQLSNINSYAYENTGGTLTLSHRYNNSLRGEFALIYAQYDFNTQATQEISSAYEHAYRIGHYEARMEYRQILSERNTLDYGLNATLYNLDRGKVLPYGTESLRKITDLGQDKGVESALYLSDAYDVFDWMNITAGVRYGVFTALGEKKVYTYFPGEVRDERNINDSIFYKKNEPIKWFAEPDVRASINIETDDFGSVKMAFNSAHQNLFMLNNTVAIGPDAQWKLADYYIHPSRSNQVSIGVFRLFPQRALEASVELYYKHINQFPEFRDGADFIETPLVETEVLQGTQKSYGVEFFLKRSSRKLEGWLSYTYSRSKVKVNSAQAWDRINEGIEYPSNYDIPHVVNLVATYHFTRRITMSSIVTYQSGKPVTYPVSVYYVDGVPTLDYSSRNAYRIPDFFRTDLAITFEGNLRKDKLLHSSFSLNLYNVTGRDNPYAVYFQTTQAQIKSYQYAVIGVPIFTASWIFKLGNYASE